MSGTSPNDPNARDDGVKKVVEVLIPVPAAAEEDRTEADRADDLTAPSPLEPNLTDINAHLYALFHPDFVKHYPDAWIEIATADPGGGKGNTGPKASKHFSAFQLLEAAEYAMKRNGRGNNVYVGMALRQGETGPSGRANQEERHHGRARMGGFRQEG